MATAIRACARCRAAESGYFFGAFLPSPILRIMGRPLAAGGGGGRVGIRDGVLAGGGGFVSREFTVLE